LTAYLEIVNMSNFSISDANPLETLLAEAAEDERSRNTVLRIVPTYCSPLPLRRRICNVRMLHNLP
jgi:hypothetical protein